MGEIIIEKLRMFVEKYPIPAMHRILCMLIMAMLRVRTHPEYALGIGRISSFVKDNVVRVAEKAGIDNQKELKGEISDLLFAIIVFPVLDEDDAESLRSYCLEILPAEKDSLESYLSIALNSTVPIPNPPSFSFGEDFVLKGAVF